MLVKNFLKFFGRTSNSVKLLDGTFGTYSFNHDYISRLCPMYEDDLEDIMASANDQSRGYFLKVGSGTTYETPDDYNLESVINNDVLEIVNGSFTYNNTHDLFMSLYITVKNITDEPVDVSEIGFFGHYAEYGTKYGCMLARETFDTITMQPDELRTFTFMIE